MQPIRTVDRTAGRTEYSRKFANDDRYVPRKPKDPRPCPGCQIIRRLSDAGWAETFDEPPTTRELILSHIERHGSASSSELYETVPAGLGHIKTVLQRMYKDGTLRRDKVCPKPKGGQPYRYFLKTS